MKNFLSKSIVSNVVAGSVILFTVYSVVFQTIEVDALVVLSAVSGFAARHLFDSQQSEQTVK